MKTISLVNEKGGVGKTTLAVHLAAGFAMRGYKVLLIDCDPQANATRQLQVDESPALHDLIVRHAPWKTLLKIAPQQAWLPSDGMTSGKLYVLPGNVETRAISTLTDDVMALRERQQELDGVIDIVINDTAPTPSLFHSMVYLATDFFL
ncbi:MAG TPA: AAA family ATPase, partial [Aggregatilineales bacterium]|nr:AAA family ATPase [Aggregatilineales bacterium]